MGSSPCWLKRGAVCAVRGGGLQSKIERSEPETWGDSGAGEEEVSGRGCDAAQAHEPMMSTSVGKIELTSGNKRSRQLGQKNRGAEDSGCG